MRSKFFERTRWTGHKKTFLLQSSAKVVSTCWLNLALNLKEELHSEEELLCCVENGPPDPGKDFPLALEIPNGCETRVDLLDWTITVGIQD